MPPHRAGPDAWVTAQILAELAKTISVEQMISWTIEPKALPTITFGKHRGSKWSDILTDYLHWMTRQTDMDEDARWCASQELSRRAQQQ
jgi:exodeoxyribonuclease X